MYIYSLTKMQKTFDNNYRLECSGTQKWGGKSYDLNLNCNYFSGSLEIIKNLNIVKAYQNFPIYINMCIDTTLHKNTNKIYIANGFFGYTGQKYRFVIDGQLVDQTGAIKKVINIDKTYDSLLYSALP
jgi:hypothetical protein